MAITRGNAFVATGVLFSFFISFLSWPGVFMLGSDTSSNTFFGKTEGHRHQRYGVNQVVSVATIFLFTLKHALILTAVVVGLMVLLQSYVIKKIVPAAPPRPRGALVRLGGVWQPANTGSIAADSIGVEQHHLVAALNLIPDLPGRIALPRPRAISSSSSSLATPPK